MLARLGDVDLYFDVDGAKLVPSGERMIERPTLLLLHGGPGFDHSHFKPGFSDFREVAQVVFFDQRGQGRSGRSDPLHWNLATWADDVAAFCDLMDIRKPIILGSSFGGFVALAVATRHPNLASGIILISTAARITVDRIVQRFGELGGAPASEAARALFADPDNPDTLSAYFEKCIPLYARTGFDASKAPRSITHFDVSSHFYRPTGEHRRFDYRSELGRVDIPILMLHGEMDPIVPVDFAIETYHSFPAGRAQLEVFADSSHDIPQDKWPETKALIRRFIETTSHANRE